jgi:hypothetical protein
MASTDGIHRWHHLALSLVWNDVWTTDNLKAFALQAAEAERERVQELRALERAVCAQVPASSARTPRQPSICLCQLGVSLYQLSMRLYQLSVCLRQLSLCAKLTAGRPSSRAVPGRRGGRAGGDAGGGRRGVPWDAGACRCRPTRTPGTPNV